MAEVIVLDPVDVAAGRTELDITPWVSSDGVDWGDAAIEQYLAEAERGQLPVDFRIPNRQISIPLKVQQRGTVTFEQARQQIQQKAGLFQREGGYLKRVTDAGRRRVNELVNPSFENNVTDGWRTTGGTYFLNTGALASHQAAGNPTGPGDDYCYLDMQNTGVNFTGMESPISMVVKDGVPIRFSLLFIEDVGNAGDTLELFIGRAGGVDYQGTNLTYDNLSWRWYSVTWTPAEDYNGVVYAGIRNANGSGNRRSIAIAAGIVEQGYQVGVAPAGATTITDPDDAFYFDGSIGGGTWTGAAHNSRSYKVVAGTASVYADVTNATLKLGGDWLQANRSADVNATLTLETTPDFYGDEIELPIHTETTLPELVFTETGIQGDYPGRMQILVEEADGETQRGLIWGIRSANYASTAPLAREAEHMQILNQASAASLSAASGGTAVEGDVLHQAWTPIVSTGQVPHRGTYRMWARLYTTDSPSPYFRLAWRSGDQRTLVENDPVQIPGVASFHLADLGEIRNDRDSWEGIIQASAGTSQNVDEVSIDRVWLVPVDEGYGVVRALASADVGASGYLVKDQFNQSAGALNGKSIATAGVIAGPNNPGTSVNVSVAGQAAWSNPTNVFSSNDTRAFVSMNFPGGDRYSQVMHVTNFGMGLPAGATISGIEVDVERKSSNASYPAVDNVVQILKAGTQVGTNKAKAGGWPTTEAYTTYGSSSDLWGTTFTQAEVNATGFGVAIQAQVNALNGNPHEGHIDHVRIRVYYTPSGGSTWVTSGDADDFNMETVGHTARRTAVSDSSPHLGRYAVAGTQVFTDVAVQMQVSMTSQANTGLSMALARYVDANNWAQAGIYQDGGIRTLAVLTCVSASVNWMHIIPTTLGGGPMLIRFAITAGGNYFLWASMVGDALGQPIAAGHNAVLATGGVLDDGKAGIYDSNSTAGANTRDYDNFLVWVPNIDALMDAGESLEIGTNGVFRAGQSTAAHVIGDLPRIPPAGVEGRSTEFFIKASRGDLNIAADSGIDDISARVIYRPSWLFVPET